jgi:zinc/manganese transport system substrate-binding protein
MKILNRKLSKISKACVSALSIALTVSLSVVLLSGCSAQKEETSAPDKDYAACPVTPIPVAASINQWGSLVKSLGGNCVDVKTVISGTSADPHDFELSPTDAAKFSDVQLVVLNGAGYDTWADNLGAQSAAEVISAAEVGGIKDGDNPHIWFSLDIVKKTADAISESLITKFTKEGQDYIKDLKDKWDEEYKTIVPMASPALGITKTYAATESVAYYLMNECGYEDKTPEDYARASQNESEPSSKAIQDFNELLTNKQVDVLINNVQEETDQTKKFAELAKENDIKVVELTEQMPDDQKTLLGWIKSLVTEVLG